MEALPFALKINTSNFEFYPFRVLVMSDLELCPLETVISANSDVLGVPLHAASERSAAGLVYLTFPCVSRVALSSCQLPNLSLLLGARQSSSECVHCSADFMEEAISMVTLLTDTANISEATWTLLPLLHAALKSDAADYFQGLCNCVRWTDVII